ncbi:MAG: hypothetical protein LBC53_08560 [Spirochaetaceae bacterium]|jgi:hypothetical protein|nr:hypothetical protein [Spirochaetaceae bacterium]
MIDLDLGILEITIAFFLFMPVIRPFVKSLWPIEGVSWFPLIALVCAAGLFFVYGFRPECIPLLLYVIVVNIINIPDIHAHISRLWNKDFIDRSFLFFFVNIFFLCLTTAVAVVFLPLSGTSLSTENVETIELKDAKNGKTFTVRIYKRAENDSPESSASRPVILVSPPISGSIGAVDLVCASVCEKGNIAVSFSRKDLDLPAYKPEGGIYMPGYMNVFNNWAVITRAREYQKENETARLLEKERENDLKFILNFIDALFRNNPKIVIGYGLGGGAAVTAVQDEVFTGEHPSLRGVVAVESYLYSCWGSEPLPPMKPTDFLFPIDFFHNLKNRFTGKYPVKISTLEDAPRPKLPVLFIVSDKVERTKNGFGLYDAVEKTVSISGGMCGIYSVKNVKAVDWTDAPAKYPFLRFIISGFTKSAWKNLDCVSNAASVFQRFIYQTTR